MPPFSIKPTIVNDDGVVAGILVPSQHHHVRHLLEEVLADAELRVVVTVRVAPEPLPGEPAHGRSPRQAIVQAGHQDGLQEDQQQHLDISQTEKLSDCGQSKTGQETCSYRYMSTAQCLSSEGRDQGTRLSSRQSHLYFLSPLLEVISILKVIFRKLKYEL